MDQETRLLLDGFEMYKKELLIEFRTELPNPKDSKLSEKMRKEGNLRFLKKNHSHELHKEILSLYNASVALAPSGSQELASAYANRSAFLLHVDKYEKCIEDVEKALEITESDELKIKLLCRRVECLKKLGSTCEKALDEAKGLLNYIDVDNDKKQKLTELVTAAAALLIAKKADASQKSNDSVSVHITDDLLERVSIRHNEKYGRHLVAKQNYIPGDIIFVEQLFLTTVKTPNRYVNCHHCLKDCWTGIPCHNCNWAIFCSEGCRQEAWKEYHDIECSVGSLLIDVLDFYTWTSCSLSIKIILKAMKDAGSINNLRTQLEAVDQNTEICSKGFYKDGKFINSTLECFYSLSTKGNFSSDEKKIVSRVALITLISLLKHPQWKDNFSIKNFNNLIRNQDLVYLGSLLIKFIAIEFNNGLAVVNFQSIYDTHRRGQTADPRGCCIATLTSLINSSCCANASRCFTEDGKIILYVVEPIEKNSQIFITYAREYYSINLNERKSYLKKYDVECDCRACIESWPALLNQFCETGDHPTNAAEAKFMREYPDIERAIAEEDYSRSTFEKLIPKIIVAFKCLEPPSTFTCMMLEALNACVTNVYDGLQPQMVGKCKKMSSDPKENTMYEIISSFFGRGGTLHEALLFMLKLGWSCFMVLGVIAGLSYCLTGDGAQNIEFRIGF